MSPKTEARSGLGHWPSFLYIPSPQPRPRTTPRMRWDVAPVESPVDDGGGDTDGHTSEGHCLAPGSLDQLLGRGHHLGRHWKTGVDVRGVRGKGTRSGWDGSEEPGRRRAGAETRERGQRKPAGAPLAPPSSLLTAANLIAAVGTVALLITVVAGCNALVCGDTAELRGPTDVLGVLGSWGTEQAVWAEGVPPPFLTCARRPTLSTFPRCSQDHSLISFT